MLEAKLCIYREANPLGWIVHTSGEEAGELFIGDLNAETIDLLLERYPERWAVDVPRLDRIGKRMRSREPIYATKEELTEIVSWKRPATGRKFARGNTSSDVESVSRKAFSKQSDSERIRELTLLDWVGVPMASAVLRFVWPDSYGTIDWRNWYVLSNTKNRVEKENDLFRDPLLRSISSVQGHSSVGINFNRYVEYLGVIRSLAEEHPKRSERAEQLPIIRELVKEYPERTPAEIDMALFSYSWDFIVK